MQIHHTSEKRSFENLFDMTLAMTKPFYQKSFDYPMINSNVNPKIFHQKPTAFGLLIPFIRNINNLNPMTLSLIVSLISSTRLRKSVSSKELWYFANAHINQKTALMSPLLRFET